MKLISAAAFIILIRNKEGINTLDRILDIG